MVLYSTRTESAAQNRTDWLTDWLCLVTKAIPVRNSSVSPEWYWRFKSSVTSCYVVSCSPTFQTSEKFIILDQSIPEGKGSISFETSLGQHTRQTTGYNSTRKFSQLVDRHGISVTEVFLCCDVMSVNTWIPTFRRQVVSSSPRVIPEVIPPVSYTKQNWAAHI